MTDVPILTLLVALPPARCGAAAGAARPRRRQRRDGALGRAGACRWSRSCCRSACGPGSTLGRRPRLPVRRACTPGSRAFGIRLPPRRRRHQPVAGAADDVPDAARAARLVGRRSTSASASSSRLHAAARDRHDRRLRRARPLPLLRVLGGDAASRCTSSSAIWGGDRRLYAAIKFFLYTLVGSLLMLVAILCLYLAAPARPPARYSFDLRDALRSCASPATQQLLAASSPSRSAFAIKVPLFPFHTWLPDAHVEAPTAGSVILAGVLLKMGTYGLIRFAFPLFPRGREALRAAARRARGDRHRLRRAGRDGADRTSRSWSPTPRSATWASSCSASPR